VFSRFHLENKALIWAAFSHLSLVNIAVPSRVLAFRIMLSTCSGKKVENLQISKPRTNTLESHGQCIIDYLEKNCDCTKFD
jgi:hypothetical protein